MDPKHQIKIFLNETGEIEVIYAGHEIEISVEIRTGDTYYDRKTDFFLPIYRPHEVRRKPFEELGQRF